jgi:arylsulfatase A
LAENTLIIFSSDNGPEHYAYPRIPKYGHSSMGPLRGLKRDIWEGGHRVPFIVRWPGVIKPGRVNDALTSQVDIMATLAAIVGADLPDNAAEDSYDQLPVWLDNTDRTQVRFEHVHNTYASKYAIRKNEWVLLDTQSGSHNERRESDWLDYEENPHKAALYNLKVDLEQRRNLLASSPEKKTEMLSLLNEIRDCGHSAPRLKNPTQNSLKR